MCIYIYIYNCFSLYIYRERDIQGASTEPPVRPAVAADGGHGRRELTKGGLVKGGLAIQT